MLEKHQNLKINNMVTSTKAEKKENSWMIISCITYIYSIHKW